MGDNLNGWKVKLIPEVLFFQEGPGVRKSQFRQSGVKLLNVGNINSQRLDLSTTSLYISEEEANGKYKHFLVDPGDLLIACSGIVVSNFHNKIAIASGKDLPLCLNTSTMRFKVTKPDEILLDYFRYFLQTELFKEQLSRLITGSAQLNFGPSHIKQIKIPLPPLETQKKIAAILDKADELRQNDKKILEKYDQLAQSVFLDMFGDTKLNPKKWDMMLIEEISSNIIDCPHSTPKYVDKITEYPCVRTTELRNGYIDWSSMKYLDREGYIDRTKRLIPKQGDIIYGREGAFGEAAIIPPNTRMSLGQRVMLFRPKYDIINSHYFLALIRSRGLYEQAVKKTNGSTVGHVNIKDIRKFTCPIPPLNLQKSFANIIDSIEYQRKLSDQSFQKSEELLQSLLHRAFKGELI